MIHKLLNRFPWASPRFSHGDPARRRSFMSIPKLSTNGKRVLTSSLNLHF